MSASLMPGMTNVYRFPVELRAKPSVVLLLNIAPDFERVSYVAESFGLEAPPYDLRDEAGQEMAEIISKMRLPDIGLERKALLTGLLNPLLDAAIKACRTSEKAEADSVAATEKLVLAERDGGYWLEPLAERSDYLAEEAARALVSAYAVYSKALGAARAVDLACAGIEWKPFDAKEEMSALLEKRCLPGFKAK